MSMSQDIHQHRILILDFGSQYTQLIARRIREIGVYCEIWPWDARPPDIREFAPRGIVLSGGPESVHADDGPTPGSRSNSRRGCCRPSRITSTIRAGRNSTCG
jgi:hypothetical protein